MLTSTQKLKSFPHGDIITHVPSAFVLVFVARPPTLHTWIVIYITRIQANLYTVHQR